MKAEVLKMLMEADGFVSGQEICSRLSVSRTAVWKVINQLKDDGCRIEAVRNRGYRLNGAEDMITPEGLKWCLHTSWAGAALDYRYEVDSTNNRAGELAVSGCPHGTLVVADSQTAGKGRRGRGWTSLHGEGVFMSLVLRPQLPPSHASMLTLVAALSTARAVKSVCGLDAGIKWPNDLVIGGKKICGILTEMSADMDFIHYVITGIGINVNVREFPPDLRDRATSLLLEAGRSFGRSEIIAAVAEEFEDCYERFLTAADLSGLRDEYHDRLVNRGREVTVLDPSGEYRGTALGINSAGELLVRTGENEIRTIVSGEVSVRGVYGYV